MYLFVSQRDKEFGIVFYSTLLYKYVWNSVQTLELLSYHVTKCHVYNRLCFPSYFLRYRGALGFPGGSVIVTPANTRRWRFDPGLGRSTREGSGNPLQYSCLKNSIDREAWLAIVPRVAKSQIQRACMQMGLCRGQDCYFPNNYTPKVPKMFIVEAVIVIIIIIIISGL